LTVAPSSRFARRRLAPALGDGAINERSTPWYRTGIGALAVVLALVAGAYWVVRRWMPSARTVDAGAMKLVGRTGLTPKQSLALVQVGRRYVVVGVSPDRLDSLCEICDPDEVAELGLRIGSQRTGAADEFNALLAGEASDYPDASPPDSDLRERESSHRAGTPGALKDLLSKLRTLQPK
jgi:flagellar biosynthetic protein FliO